MIDTVTGIIENETLILGVLSNVRRGIEKSFNKVDVKPVMIRQQLMYQFTYHYDKKVTHENLSSEEAIETLVTLLNGYFRQGMIFTVDGDYQILFNKKGQKMRIVESPPSRHRVDLSHNREKNYLLQDGVPTPFLEALGIMNHEGKVNNKRFDKFKQINRYLEFIRDVLPNLPENKTLTIIDFGCGKAYLTFALYHYLVNILNRNVKIIGLDLKEDVIKSLQAMKKDLGFDGLNFEVGDIRDYSREEDVDMVVSLHACDTATDEALAKAVTWNAKVILAVPCCQHELFKKIDNSAMAPILDYGVAKDKLATLITDGLRVCALEILGYNVQMVEFIDMEHTPKNVLIRGVLRGKSDPEAVKRYLAFKKAWNLEDIYIEQAFGKLLRDSLLEEQ